MKKRCIVILTFIFTLLFFNFKVEAFPTGSISARIDPPRTSYMVGEMIRIYWTYTGISSPSSRNVKIILKRKGEPSYICRIASSIPLIQGSSGYTWRVPSTCTNPRTGRIENLLQGKLKVRVKLIGEQTLGDTNWFTVITLTSLRDVPTKPHAPIPQPSRPEIYNLRFGPVMGNHGIYQLTWDFRNVSRQDRSQLVQVSLWREDASGPRKICNIKNGRVPLSWKQVIINAREDICDNGTKPPYSRSRDYRMRVELANNPSINGITGKFMLPVFPDLIVCVEEGKALHLNDKDIHVKVVNLSEYPGMTVGPFNVRFYIEGHGTKSYDVTLPYGTIYELHRTVTFYTIEKQTVKVEVDVGNRVRELNEQNNSIEVYWDVEPLLDPYFDPVLPVFKCSDGTSHLFYEHPFRKP